MAPVQSDGSQMTACSQFDGTQMTVRWRTLQPVAVTASSQMGPCAARASLPDGCWPNGATLPHRTAQDSTAMIGMLPQARLYSQEHLADSSAAGKRLTKLSSQATPTSFRARVTAGHTSRRYFSAERGTGALLGQSISDSACAQAPLCIGLLKHMQLPSAQRKVNFQNGLPSVVP